MTYVLPLVCGLAVVTIAVEQTASAAPAGPATSATDDGQKATEAGLLGVIGDVLIDSCSSGNAQCSKAWADLGRLAEQSAL